MEERLYELEDKVQDLELEVHDLRDRIQLLKTNQLLALAYLVIMYGS